MRKSMSVGDLKRYYEGRGVKRILFCSENQAWNKVENPLNINLTFTSMLMACNPNVICLKCGDNTMHFEKVKRIYLDADRSPLGTVLDIVCGDSNTRGNDIKYTLIVS